MTTLIFPSTWADVLTPVSSERLRHADELAPRFRSAIGYMRRHYEDCLVSVFQGNGGEVQIREHAELRIVMRAHIEDYDLESAIAWMENPPRDALKDRYRNLPDKQLPRFRRPANERTLRRSLLTFYRRHCLPRSCEFIRTWFGIQDLQAGGSAQRDLR